MVSGKRFDKILADLCDTISKQGVREKEVVRALEIAGFERVGGKGSHRSFRHPDLIHPESLHGRIRFPIHDQLVKRPYVRQICSALLHLRSVGAIP
ncbi:type II toxin-antitoxin system HicA family toxin [bacterium]|nr:type II toxin-antitoxin system HicA family toxin [bacterium]